MVDLRIRRRHAQEVGRTALIVPVPEAEPLVSSVRLRYDSSASLGVPAHVTVLSPFQDGSDVEEAELTELFGAVESFDFVLDRVERFREGVVWLHPEPSQPFAELTEAVWRRWPDWPPYEGVFGVVIPHLTVSETPIDFALDAPISARARWVTLLERSATGRWAARSRFKLR